MSGHRLRILIANEKLERLATLASLVQTLGHDVVARSVSARDVAACAVRERVDIALVGLGESTEHALELVSEIVADAYCPVIAVLSEEDPVWVNEAAQRGVFAYVIAGNVPGLGSAIDIAIQRFKEQRKVERAIRLLKLDARHEAGLSQARLGRIAELHDEVVQGLVTAKLAYEMGRGRDSYTAVRDTLDRARAIVNRSLVELKRQGVRLEQAIGVVAPSQRDE